MGPLSLKVQTSVWGKRFLQAPVSPQVSPRTGPQPLPHWSHPTPTSCSTRWETTGRKFIPRQAVGAGAGKLSPGAGVTPGGRICEHRLVPFQGSPRPFLLGVWKGVGGGRRTAAPQLHNTQSRAGRGSPPISRPEQPKVTAPDGKLPTVPAGPRNCCKDPEGMEEAGLGATLPPRPPGLRDTHTGAGRRKGAHRILPAAPSPNPSTMHQV